jgi:DNA-binding NtrC family response regulator
MPRILIVDDDRETCRFIEELLEEPGRDFVSAYGPEDAIVSLQQTPFDLLISDINLNAARSGLDVLRAFKAAHPRGEVVLISGFGTLETAVEAVRAGAFDYVSKPFNIAEVKATVDRALRQAARADEDTETAPTAMPPPSGLLGRTAPMLAVYNQIARAAESAAPVLVIGESGTGKELAARAVHAHGPRAREPFLAVNCGAIAETLLESELFGHTRGAFTGAVSDARGIFEQAGSGTVLLDEIGETSAAMQVKLLRTLEESEVRPVGGSRAIRVKARIIAATNADLEREVGAGRFRQDLYYRLSVILIRMPLLRDRRADIPLLMSRFLENASARAGRRVTLSAEALDALMRYEWPGNVRELENTIERLVVFCRGSVIDLADLPAEIQGGAPSADAELFAGLPTLDEMERRYLLHVLEQVGGNRTRAAEVLRIDRRTLYRMAERLGITLKD